MHLLYICGNSDMTWWHIYKETIHGCPQNFLHGGHWRGFEAPRKCQKTDKKFSGQYCGNIVKENCSLLTYCSIYYTASSIPWHPLCSIYVSDSLFAQSLSRFSLVYLLVWHPALHTPYFSSPNHCLLFSTHAHTIATSFAVLPRLCHLILVSLSQPFTLNSIL